MPGSNVGGTRGRLSALCCGAAASALIAGSALAQAAPQPEAVPAAKETTTLGEVVVTGTSIRGVAPAGAPVTGVNQEQIQASGALSASQVLAQVPSITNQFAQLPTFGTTASNAVQVNRPNLHNLPGQNLQSGNSTLVLVDGHRIASAGVSQFAPDPDVVPPSVLERVEIVPDGGSSIYGSDAVGGVINFVTKRRVQGVHVDARAGITNHYNQINTDVLAGKSWDTGSVYGAVDYEHNTPLFSRFRDYPRAIDWNTGIPTETRCYPPTIAAAGVNYAYPGLTPGTTNNCDTAQEGTIASRQTRYSLYGGLSQDFGTRVKFDLRTYFTQRDSWAGGGLLRSNTTVTPSNPFYVDIPTAPGASQNVGFAIPNVEAYQISRMRVWGVTPTVSYDLGHDWQLRGMFNYGGSHTTYQNNSINQTLLDQAAGGTTTDTAFNPYNPQLTPNQALFNSIVGGVVAGESKVNMLNLRAIADGPVATLPGGQVRLAVGVEWLRNHLDTRNSGQAPLTEAEFKASPFSSYTQGVKSVFGELQIPVVGEGNRLPGVYAFNISASARYDSYSDFGSTTNPRVGVTYQPVDWLTLRGSWGKSFNAPTPVDELGSLQSTILSIPFAIFPYSKVPANPGDWALVLLGSAPNLKPQTSTQYNVGFDVNWPMINGLKTSVSYYHINYNQQLGQPPIFLGDTFFQSYPAYYILNPTQAQIATTASLVKGGPEQLAFLLTPGAPHVYEILDFRQTNLGDAIVAGLDFSTQYRHSTDFGGYDVSVSGNWQLLNQGLNAGLPSTNFLVGVPRVTLSAAFGVDYHRLRAQATLYHIASASQQYNAVSLPQDSIPSFNPVNLFFRYDLNGEGWRKDLSMTLNIDNVFDAQPPVWKALGGGSQGSTKNGSTLGRMFTLGVHKDF